MKKYMQVYGETVFDLGYLLFMWTAARTLYLNFTGAEQLLFTAAALALAIGDSAHLLPRIYALHTRGLAYYRRMLGWGKLITSLTMTLFYVLLWQIYLLKFGGSVWSGLNTAVVVLALLRVLLCLLPQNRFFQAATSNHWSIIRNIPLFLLGLIVGISFGFAQPVAQANFTQMGPAIAVSFVCYIPVVIRAHRYPKLGMLMLPKTCAYIWMIVILLRSGS